MTEKFTVSFNAGQDAVIQDGYIVFRTPTQPPTPSASGKTLVVASTRGNKSTTAAVNGKPVIVGFNAYINP